MHMVQNACNLDTKMPILHNVTYAMQNARNAQRKSIRMVQRSFHTPNPRNQTHQAPRRKRVKVV
jgi:hypothetical protein